MLRNIFKKDKSGFYQGKHYTAYVERVKELKQQGKLAEVERLLKSLIMAVEIENMARELPKEPWYTEQLALVYHTQQRYDDEVAILGRYDRGTKKPLFSDRIAQAQALAAKSA